MVENSILPAVWQVPQVFRDRLGREAGRQRAMQADGHLLLVLHAPPGPEDDHRNGRFFWRNPEGQWASDAFGGGPQALNKQLSEYASLTERFERQEDAAVDAEDYFEVISAIAPLKRAARHQHEVLQQARQLCPEDREIIVLRDRAYQIERMSELLYDEAKNGLEFSMARRAEEQAQSSHKMAVAAHRLNLLAAFFFPIATLTAIFGVNLRFGLEEVHPPIPFLACIGIGLLLGLILMSKLRRDSKAVTSRLRHDEGGPAFQRGAAEA